VMMPAHKYSAATERPIVELAFCGPNGVDQLQGALKERFPHFQSIFTQVLIP